MKPLSDLDKTLLIGDLLTAYDTHIRAIILNKIEIEIKDVPGIDIALLKMDMRNALKLQLEETNKTLNDKKLKIRNAMLS